MKDNTQLTGQVQKSLKKLRTGKDIVIVPAHKGRTTVIMFKEEYIRKVEELLEDKIVFGSQDTNPIEMLDKSQAL